MIKNHEVNENKNLKRQHFQENKLNDSFQIFGK